MNKWVVLASKYVLYNRWLRIRQDEVSLPNGKRLDDYFVLETPRVVMILALTTEGKIVWVKQYKHGIGEVMIELPAGWVDGGETADLAIRRELAEETGFEAKELNYLGKLASSVSRTNEVIEVYEAVGVEKTKRPQWDANEEIEVWELTTSEVEDKIRSGEIWASVSMAAYELWKEKTGK